MARYKDRKLNRTFTFVGSDVFADGTARGQAKSIYEPGSNIVNNWDVVEGVLDYVFMKMSIDGNNGGIDRPIVITEAVANLGYTRRSEIRLSGHTDLILLTILTAMSEILFECYGAPKVAYGIDSLFSYDYNGGQSGLVISSSYTSTHIIPIINHKPMLSHATRLNWGRFQSADYLQKLLKLKYPSFPGKVTEPQFEDLVREHCHISKDYEQELSSYLDWTGLEERSHIIQWPFTEVIVPQKSEEELARQAEKRKENGRRLQEQSAKMRLEKLVRKEQELEYYKSLQAQLVSQTKKEIKRILEGEDFEEETHLNRKVKEMEISIRRARNKDVGDFEEDVEVPTYPLLDIPDADLDEDGVKQKRAQRLLKANHDARARAKAEKEREKARKAEEEGLDKARREADPGMWVEERRAARHV